jgi:hypothetical protein
MVHSTVTTTRSTVIGESLISRASP